MIAWSRLSDFQLSTDLKELSFNMTRIVFASSYSFDEPVVRNRLTPFIDAALDRGFSVTLVNPIGGHYHRDNDTCFEHLALELPQANRGGFFIRTLREIILSWKILNRIPKNNDVVFITIPSMFLLFLFHGYSEAIKVVDVRDLTWEYLSDKSKLFKTAKLFFRYLAIRKFRSFDYFCVTNKVEKKYLGNRMEIEKSRIILCTNGISNFQFKHLVEAVKFNTCNSHKRPCITYIGNVGVAQNLMTLVEAAKLLPDVDFRIVGGGSDMQRIEAAVRHVPNLVMVGRIDWGSIPAEYQMADILWAQLTPEFSGAVPSKLYEYLTTGKHVIYGGLGESVSVISEFDGVDIVQPSNVNDLVALIKHIINSNKHRCYNFANRGLIQEKYIREVAVNRFYQTLELKI